MKIRLVFIFSLSLTFSHFSFAQSYDVVTGDQYNSFELHFSAMADSYFYISLSIGNKDLGLTPWSRFFPAGQFKELGLKIDSSIERGKYKNINYSIPEVASSANILRLNTKSLFIVGDTINASFQDAEVQHMTLMARNTEDTNCVEGIQLSASRIKKLKLFRSLLSIKLSGNSGLFDCEDSKIDSLWLDSCTIEGKRDVLSVVLPKYINLNELAFETPDSKLDLANFKISDSDRVCSLLFRLPNAQIDQFRLNYENFSLTFDSTYSRSEKERVYRQLLEEQQKDGFIFGYQKLDREYRKFKYTQGNGVIGKIQNWLDSTWWDYGYDKMKVIYNSIKIFAIFVLLNCLIYSKLKLIYYPEKFKDLDDRIEAKSETLRSARALTRTVLNCASAVVYTAYVFWGVKIDLKEISLRKPVFFLILIFEYILGIICLAYLANYIISK